MASIRPGRYALQMPGNSQLLTLPGGQGAPVIIMPPTGNGDQEWIVAQGSKRDTYTFQSAKTRAFLGLDEGQEVGPNAMLRGSPQPKEFTVQPGEGRGAPAYVIRTEGNEDYPEFFVAQSMLLIYPPMSALMPAYGGQQPAWEFKSVE